VKHAKEQSKQTNVTMGGAGGGGKEKTTFHPKPNVWGEKNPNIHMYTHTQLLECKNFLEF